MNESRCGLPAMVAHSAWLAGSPGGLKSPTCAGLTDARTLSGGDILTSTMVIYTQALEVEIIGQSTILNSILTSVIPIPGTHQGETTTTCDY
jgi:hypothetical protein